MNEPKEKNETGETTHNNVSMVNAYSGSLHKDGLGTGLGWAEQEAVKGCLPMAIFSWRVGYGLLEADRPDGRTAVVWSGSLGGSRRCGQVTAKSSNLNAEDGGLGLLTSPWLAARSSINRQTANGCSGDPGGEGAVTQVILKRGGDPCRGS